MTQALPAQRITRARIVELGRTQAGWPFLSLAAQALRIAPGDDEVRLLAGRALAQLGLPGLARIVLEHVRTAGFRNDRDRLLAALESGGACDLDQLVAQARANLQLIEGIDAEPAIEAWVSDGADYHRAADANVVRVPRGAGDLPELDWLSDLVRGAAEFCRAHLGDAARLPKGPITIEGVSPPWLMLAIDRATPRLSDGYQPLLQIVQRDVAELAEGLSLADVREVFSRAAVFAGEEAGAQLEAHIRARFDFQAVGPVVPTGTLRARVEPSVLERMTQLSDEQKAESLRLRGELIARDRARDDSWWRGRWAEPGVKRVLIPTCRYSTFIQHASEDLAEAFRTRGWEARVLVEPDDSSRLSAFAYYREQIEFDPDLIVLINFPRGSRAESFPTQTPYVCWVQDSMPHLYDENVGRSHGPRDFIAGHVYPQLFRRFGYPHERALSMPVVVNTRKFHDAPVEPEPAGRLACDVAYVSHHSETPEQMHARMCSEAGDPRIVRVLDQMQVLIAERYEAGMSGREAGSLKRIPGDAWARAHGHTPTSNVLEQLQQQYLVPMLERIVRHETLAWAAQVCERRGWRLCIFGRGWDRHERFAAHACGELQHGEQLRVCYQAAGVHLHASMTTLVHQRVMECALSGGLPLCRVVAPNLGASRQKVLATLARDVEPDERRPDGMLVYRVCLHDELQALAQTYEAAGMKLEDEVLLHPQTAHNMQRFSVAFDVHTPEQVFGNLAASTFVDSNAMERLMERALTDRAWRAQRSRAIADHVRTNLTHDVLIERLEAIIRGSL